MECKMFDKMSPQWNSTSRRLALLLQVSEYSVVWDQWEQNIQIIVIVSLAQKINFVAGESRIYSVRTNLGGHKCLSNSGAACVQKIA